VVVIVRTVTFIFLGTDFQDSSFSTLERLEQIAPAVREYCGNQEHAVAGSFVVATCNRFEVYLDTVSSPEVLAGLVQAVADLLGEPVEHASKMFRVLHDSGAVAHLFHVASGLESMVVGEGEIMSQLRDAMAWAKDLGTLSPALHSLTERAFRASKKVSGVEGFGQSGRSVIDTALELANRHGEVSAARVLVVGTGAYARVVLAALKRQSVAQVSVFSRSGRAHEFAESHGVQCVEPQSLLAAVSESDLVISASGQPGYVITQELYEGLPQESRPRVFIDVALSRDIDPRVEEDPLATIITLESIRRAIPQDHSERIALAEAVVGDEIKQFLAERPGRSLAPVAATLRSHVEALITQELEAAAHRLGEQEVLEIKRSLRRVTGQLLHNPLVRGRELASKGETETYRQAIDLVFGLQVSDRA
jgi:glutamyl-tRNA reductase